MSGHRTGSGIPMTQTNRQKNIHPIHSKSHASKAILKQLQGRETSLIINLLNKLPFYQDLSRSTNIDDFKQRISSKLETLGFSDFAYARLDANGGTTAGLSTTREDMLRTYQSEAFYEYDLVMQHSQKKSTPIFTSTIENYIADAPFDNDLFDRNFEIIRMNKCYHFYDSYTIPFDTLDNNRAALSVLSQGMERIRFQESFRTHAAELDSTAQIIDYIAITQFPEYFGQPEASPTPRIPPKPLMLLNILAKNNLTLSEAAKSMAISIHTANKHAATFKKLTGANTLAAAVYIALLEGLIHLD